MGVTGLWSILSPIQEHVPIRSLGGQVLAIDLSGWICGDIMLNQRVQTGNKLYIRWAGRFGDPTSYVRQIISIDYVI